jgi:hypothetical protein
MTLEQNLSEKSRELKDLKRVFAKELHSLYTWADSHLAVKDV